MGYIMDENSLEVLTAIRAVKMASSLCEKVGKDLIGKESLLKSDRSPVTVADYGSQAILCKLIKEKFPEDVIVAEEDSSELKNPVHSKILEQVTRFVHAFFPDGSSKDVCRWIDFSSQRITDRFWAMDPIDGTKGFLRGDQYAIALALIENGRVVLGLLGCPNLHVDKARPGQKRGCLFYAVRGKGAIQMDLESGDKRLLHVSNVKNPSDIILTESVESDHSDHLFHERFREKLDILEPTLRVDSQVKYGIVARGEATLYLRIPSTSEPGYKENVWDHAAGAIITEEAEGKVTDALGRPLEFAAGIKMEKNEGIVASNGILHDVVLKALKGV
jgi:3'(2'), 5'-bisphosphate nucleotidase